MDFFQCQANFSANVPSPSLWYTLQTPQDLSVLKSSGNLDLGGSPFIPSPDRRTRLSYGTSFPQICETFTGTDSEKHLESKLEHSFVEGDFSAVKQESFANPDITSNFQPSQTIYFSHLHRSQVSFPNHELTETARNPRDAKSHVSFNPLFREQELPRVRENEYETVWACLHKGPAQPTHNISFDQETSSMINYTADSLFYPSSSFTQETDILPKMNAAHSHEEYGRFGPKNCQGHEGCSGLEDSRDSPKHLKQVPERFGSRKNPKSKKIVLKKEKKTKTQSLQDVTNFSFLTCNMETTKGEKHKSSKNTFEIMPNPLATAEVDSKVRAHRCHICDKVFKRPSSYRIHYTIHSGEKQFSCSKCGKAFNVKSNLTRHEKLHGRPGGPKKGYTQKGGGRQKRYVY